VHGALRREQNRTAGTRIFSPLAVAELCVTIGRYWYLFKCLTTVSAGRSYRFEHIDTIEVPKVTQPSLTAAVHMAALHILYFARHTPDRSWANCVSLFSSHSSQNQRIYTPTHT
jgi:hypothetical protein